MLKSIALISDSKNFPHSARYPNYPVSITNVFTTKKPDFSISFLKVEPFIKAKDYCLLTGNFIYQNYLKNL